MILLVVYYIFNRPLTITDDDSLTCTNAITVALYKADLFMRLFKPRIFKPLRTENNTKQPKTQKLKIPRFSLAYNKGHFRNCGR